MTSVGGVVTVARLLRSCPETLDLESLAGIDRRILSPHTQITGLAHLERLNPASRADSGEEQ
ncbi:MAG TPA: hypothetical protein VGC23_02085 [Vicinamibacterales bacterium]